MNYYTKDTLLTTVEDSTKLVELTLDEATAIISEYGGRLLALFPRIDCYNLLWVNSNPKNIIETRNRAIGGDRYPGSRLIDHLLRYEANPKIRMLVCLGEIGGTEEYEIVDALKNEAGVSKSAAARAAKVFFDEMAGGGIDGSWWHHPYRYPDLWQSV